MRARARMCVCVRTRARAVFLCALHLHAFMIYRTPVMQKEFPRIAPSRLYDLPYTGNA